MRGFRFDPILGPHDGRFVGDVTLVTRLTDWRRDSVTIWPSHARSEECDCDPGWGRSAGLVWACSEADVRIGADGKPQRVFATVCGDEADSWTYRQRAAAASKANPSRSTNRVIGPNDLVPQTTP